MTATVVPPKTGPMLRPAEETPIELNVPTASPEQDPLTAVHRCTLAALGGLSAILLLWLYHAFAVRWYWWHELPFWHADRFRLELPLILTAVLLCAWPAGRRWWSWLLGCAAGVVPVLAGIICIDLFARNFDRVPTLLDAPQVADLLRADAMLGIGVILALLAALSPPLVAFACWCHGRGWRLGGAALAMRLSLASCLLAVFWSQPTQAMWIDRAHSHVWSDLHAVKDRGHLTAVYASTARMLSARKRLQTMPPIVGAPRFPVAETQPRRGIHILLLESFVDPRDLLPAIDRSIHPDMLALLGADGRFDTCISPIFGGASAQAEFELLTGAPALREFGPIDYALLDGRPVDGLVATARAAGYRTVLAYGATSMFFNALDAHRSLGFDEQHYAERDPWGAREAGDPFITDADLTTAVLDRLGGMDGARPLLSFTVGIEGHVQGTGWFRRDEARFPPIVPAPPALAGLADISFWRSQAIAAWFTRIAREWPDDVALAVADHQPIVLGAQTRHRRGSYAVPALLQVAGQRVSVDGRHLWELPWLVWRHAAVPACAPPARSQAISRYRALLQATPPSDGGGYVILGQSGVTGRE